MTECSFDEILPRRADSGAGCNFAVLDVTGEGRPDVFTTNKRGTFLHAQR